MSWYDDNGDRLLNRAMSPIPKYLDMKYKEAHQKHSFVNHEGKTIVIEEMSDRYLENIINYIVRSGDKKGKLHYFQKEKARRQKYNIKIEE